ncbi:MAG: cytochrome c [Candidatus Bipolaricaulia bacterium]
MRLKSSLLLLILASLGWGLLVGCGGPMPTPPQQDQTPMTADQSKEQKAGEQHQQQPDQSSQASSQQRQATEQATSPTEKASQPASDRFAVAKEIIRQQSCGSCHTIQARGLDLTGQVGPELTNEGSRNRTDEWLRQQLIDPTSVPDDEVVDGFEGMQSTMPSYGRQLSDKQISRLVAFLQSLSSSAETQADQATQTDASQAKPSQTDTAQPQQTSADPMGLAKQVIREQSCGSCHTLQARGLNLTGQVGPDLTNEGARGRSDEWLRRQITHPSAIPDSDVVDGFEGMQSTMPSYERRLSDSELDALVQFLQGLNGADD